MTSIFASHTIPGIGIPSEDLKIWLLMTRPPADRRVGPRRARSAPSGWVPAKLRLLVPSCS